jgi:thioredoxin reductase (NADPH)
MYRRNQIRRSQGSKEDGASGCGDDDFQGTQLDDRRSSRAGYGFEMSRPVIVCVDNDPTALALVEHELSKRYGVDYEIRSETSAETARELIRSLVAEECDLALVIVDASTSETTGTGLLADARAVSPSTRRALLVMPGYRPIPAAVLHAATLGTIHCWLVKPIATGLVEEFHHSVTDALYGWSSEQRPFELVRVVGAAWSRRTHEIRDLLARNRVPFGFYDVASDEGQQMLHEFGVSSDRLPVVAIGDRDVLVQPSFNALAAALGGETRPRSTLYDVVVVGAGPAGLAAAVSASSEGLRTVVLEPEAIGGQAGTSSLIRNYLGFPMGISGAELALRAFHQAMLFGTEFVFANLAVGLAVDGDERVVTLSEGGEVRGRSVVIASGASWRRLGIPSVEARIGAGVYYGAATTEAEAMAGLDVCVVGGGNSAGQAALKLAQHAKHVTMLVRGPTLAESMSDYLVRELERAPDIDVRFNTAVVGCHGDPSLEALELRDITSGADKLLATRALFVLIGAVPATDWLPPSIMRDRWGYVLTGADVERANTRSLSLFETAVPRVFGVGDVRYGSTKRVASAVGEGSVCIRFVHEQLAAIP